MVAWLIGSLCLITARRETRLHRISMNNGNSPLKDTIEVYYEQENKRRAEWIEETLRGLIPDVLYLKWKSAEDKQQLEAVMRNWLKEEGYRMEISPDNILIQVWKGDEQIAQYQTVLPQIVQFVDGTPPVDSERN